MRTVKKQGGGLDIMERLLRKRVTDIVENLPEIDLEQLVEQLRRSFPEYQRKNKTQFIALVKNHFGSEKDSNDPEGTDSREDEIDTCSESSGVIEEAMGDFIESERLVSMNKGLRDLYEIKKTVSNGQPVPHNVSSTVHTSNPEKRKTVKRKKQNETSHSDKKQKSSETNNTDAPMAKSFLAVPRCIKYSDLGGMENVIQDIKELVEYPLKHPEVYDWLGIDPPRGVLLHGPPGCGKTVLAHAIARECNVSFFKISAPEIVSGMSGDSEAKIRSLFSEALQSVPAIIFIDEIDAIASKREYAQREMERRIVAQMLTCMDDLASTTSQTLCKNVRPDQERNTNDKDENMPQGHVIVLGATNRPDVLDPALRRAGRFDREIALGIPTEASRVKILNVMCAKLRLEGDFDFSRIARKTPGFVGADLEALTREAAALAVTRIFSNLKEPPPVGSEFGQVSDIKSTRFGAGTLTEKELSGLAITMKDFLEALPKVQPSLGREGFTTKPGITWDDVGSLSYIREELSFAICQPILHPEKFENLGLSLASGVLLYGPPGCGKTLVAKAVANEAGTNFISIKGPELLNKYVGESERAVRQLFNRARAARPCVLFFDEMDALAPKRGMDNNQAVERLVNQLLTEMDGVDCREGVYVIAATNRPDIIDSALLRPGRLDKILFVPLPDASGRISILKTLSRNSPLSEGVDFEKICMDWRCEGFSGADLAALVKEACVIGLKESIKAEASDGSKTQISRDHFELALEVVKPSVSASDLANYEQMRQTLRSTRSHHEPL